MCLTVVLHEVPGHRVDLHGKLASGGYDNGAGAIAWHELGSMQQLQRGNQESQCLARSCVKIDSCHSTWLHTCRLAAVRYS